MSNDEPSFTMNHNHNHSLGDAVGSRQKGKSPSLNSMKQFCNYYLKFVYSPTFDRKEVLCHRRRQSAVNVAAMPVISTIPSRYHPLNDNNGRINLIRILLLVFIICYLLSYSHFVMLLMNATQNQHLSSSPVQFGINDNIIPYHNMKMQQQQQQPIDEAQFIIQKSYAESYGRMMSCEPHIIEKDCIKLVIDDIMMKQQQAYLNNVNGSSANTMNATSPEDVIAIPKVSSSPVSHNFKSTYFQQQIPDDHPYPWWFTTLLRDILTNGAYGPWHHFSTVGTTPPIRFCAMGKNACTEWRRVFKDLNAPEFCSDGDGKEKSNHGGGGAGGECKSQFNTATPLSHDPNTVPNAVFIRDPLERLLSAYLDKCIKPNIRRIQGHCEPNIIFGVDYLERIVDQSNNNKQQQWEENSNNEAATRTLPDLMETLQNRDKELFAAYVDLLPLKWNVHFVPQAITCDLYRNIHTYDFVGVMGKQFMSELDRMVHRYGSDDESSSSSLLASVLNDTFQYQSKLQNESIANLNLGADNNHGTKAPSKVSKYYSARSVRRALEYLSIDYVTLGLEVPEWATEMLSLK